MAPQKKSLLSQLSAADKAALFIKSGISFALARGTRRESIEDIVDAGVDLMKMAVISELICIFQENLSPKGKPPSTSLLIDAFNLLVANAHEVSADTDKLFQRFTLMIETLAAKDERTGATLQ